MRGARLLATLTLLAATVVSASCFDRGDRYRAPVTRPTVDCTEGTMRCTDVLERCDFTSDGLAWTIVDDCAEQGLVCAPTLLACKPCIPDQTRCLERDVVRCEPDGEAETFVETCQAEAGEACRVGACRNLCEVATLEKSNVGCEYWAVDLDNAMIDDTSNAAAQQFAVVVSNPQPDVPVSVRVFIDTAAPGEPSAPLEIASANLAPLNLRVFKLGPREVDGSPEGTYDTGSHTALTRQAFRVESDFPVVAYQFNPLENVSVFSNDASLLKPREAVTNDSDGMVLSYVVVGWPQTIAATDDPSTNFNPLNPIHLRASLTLVGTRDDTAVRVHTTAGIVAGGPIPATDPGETIETTLDAFEVLNLETGDFAEDFTGTLIEADGPLVVFTGGEASDAPHFETLADRRCCADHLEDQLVPIRTAGRRYAVAHTPSRTVAISEAGADVGVVPEPDYVRFAAVFDGPTVIETTLPPPDDRIELDHVGDWAEVRALRDFMAESDQPVVAAQIMSSQDAAGIRRGLPGGDPSLMMLPPLEQARPDYVFLTPDKYAFDYVSVVAPPQAIVLLDDTELSPELCEIAPADGLSEAERGSEVPPLVVYRCQLSSALIDPSTEPPTITEGLQNDGVHRIVSDFPINVTVMGFDSFVSYAYAAGTELREIATPE